MKPVKPLLQLRQKLRLLGTKAQLLSICYRDKRTPWFAKLLVAITVGYLLSPVDLIPDFIPVLGLLDDLLIVPALVSLSLKLISAEVVNDATEKLKTQPLAAKNSFVAAIVLIVIWVVVVWLVVRKFFD